MNANVTEHTTAIMVSDPLIAIKANRNSNEGFMFYSVGAPVKGMKFNLILFACVTSTHVMKEWAKDVIENCLAEGGQVLGYIPPGKTASEVFFPPKDETVEELEKITLDTKNQKNELAAQIEEIDPQEKKAARRKAKKIAKGKK